MQCINVATNPNYEVIIGQDILEDVTHYADDCGSECIIVSDSNVANLYLPRVRAALTAAGMRVGEVVFTAGESCKTLATAGKLLDAFAQFKLTRSGVVLALGGGVTGDLAGFASAVWLRGVPVIQLPTTLLAMVDSAVGGKTGVDLPYGKNLIGAFHQPRKVLADINTLKTLPEEQHLDGVAEMLKAGITRDPELFAKLLSEPQSALSEEAIARSISIKAEIVVADEFERGERKLLNLGHTAGHAIEKVSNYRIRHGRAVAMGMVLVADAGWRHGITSEACRDAIIEALARCNLPLLSPYQIEELLPAMGYDKKRTGSKITLAVPKEIGQCELLELAVEELPAFWGAKGVQEL
jgi:3-dehydroquinate synthase